MDNLLKNNEQGFNQYHSKLVYKGTDIAEFDALLNSQDLLEQGNDAVFQM
ncbi:MAG: hypothetical protein ACI8ZF_000375, partial [Candidatus Midichloriaceae bacterium]